MAITNGTLLNVQPATGQLTLSTNYLDLAEIARKSTYIIGNDTGPMHLLVQCSNVSAKKIVLFGSHSNPRLCAPKGKNVFIIQKNNINDILLNDIKKLLI